jgi:TRAP-type C4-dicarboxylate transport system substrate-binding protein
MWRQDPLRMGKRRWSDCFFAGEALVLFLLKKQKSFSGGLEKMKRTRGMIASTLALIMVLFSLGASAFAGPVELTYLEEDTPTSLSGVCAQTIKEEIEKHTKGQVKVKIFWGGAVLKSSEALDGIGEGVVDMGLINPNYFPNKLPMNGVYATFAQGPSSFEGLSWLYKADFEKIPELKEEILRNNQVPLFAISVLPKSIVSTKPIASMADFKGKKIRASNRWALSHLEYAGAIPVSVPWSDCFMALQTGTVDAVYTNLDSIHRSKMGEAAKNIFLMKPVWSGTKMIVTINKDKWNGFSKETRDQIDAAMASASKRYGKAFSKEWDTIVKEQKKMGLTVKSITKSEVEKWSNMPAMAKLQATWVAEREKDGIKNAKDIFARIKSTVDEAIMREKQ